MPTNALVVSVPTDSLYESLANTNEGVEIVKWTLDGPPPKPVIDMVVLPYMSDLGVLNNLANVTTRLVQSQAIGYDGVEGLLPPGLVFSNAAGVHETSTAELTLALILASQRGIADFVRDATLGRWKRRLFNSLADREVLLVGYGGLGQAIERRLLPFEVSVTRVASRERHDEQGVIHSVTSLPVLLPDVDIVVVCVPLNDHTEGLINDHFLSLMADGSLLVNVSRGLVADTEALVRHATSGRLRLALDVTDPEPLPDHHPLFSLENVLITPHVGGASSAMFPRVTRLLENQIHLLQQGAEPVNVVLRS
jgi:phosphoglycerate dehydrogenase-like enzyme